MNSIIKRIEWVRGQIGLNWKSKSAIKRLNGKGYDYNEQRTYTYSTKTPNGTKIIIQESGCFWRGRSEDPYDDIVHTDSSACRYKLQIIPKKGLDFACGSREVRNHLPRTDVDSELESLFDEISCDPN